MGKNKGKKFKSGVDMLYFAAITNIDYDKLDADPNDETAYTYGSWIRARGAEEVNLESQFASSNTAADNNKNYISQKKNNGYAGNIRVTTLPPEFFTEICQMENFVEDSDTIPLPFATAWEYKEEGVKVRRVLWHCELTQLPAIKHTTESGELTIDDDQISINANPREGSNKITAPCTEGEPAFATFFDAVPQPSAFSGGSVKISGDDTVEVSDTITLTATTAPAGKAVTWSSLDEDNATVTSGGVVSGVAEGTATIKCALTSDPTVFTTKTITVTAAATE